MPTVCLVQKPGVLCSLSTGLPSTLHSPSLLGFPVAGSWCPLGSVARLPPEDMTMDTAQCPALSRGTSVGGENQASLSPTKGSAPV